MKGLVIIFDYPNKPISCIWNWAFVFYFSMFTTSLSGIFILYALFFFEFVKGDLCNIDLLRQISAIIIVIFGLVILGFFKFDFLQSEKKFLFKSRPKGYLGTIIIGMGFEQVGHHVLDQLGRSYCFRDIGSK